MRIRIDDFPYAAPARLDADHERFEPIFAELEARRLPYTLAVVPAHLDDADRALLRRLVARGCTVAVHGWNHCAPQWRAGNRVRCEFGGQDSASVLARLQAAWQALAEFTPTMYIPPFNALTPAIIDALEQHTSCRQVTTGPQVTQTIKHRLTSTELTVWTPRTEFYHRSSIVAPYMPLFSSRDHVSLHLTWEVTERERYKQQWALPAILDRVQEVIACES